MKFDFNMMQKKKPAEKRLADQKAVDAPILEAIKKVPYLKSYLKARFSLKNGVNPHEIKF